MKKLLVVVVVVAIALVGASAAMAGVIGSLHDLTTAASYSGATQSACAYCHTPHHSIGSAAPLWNRTLIATGYTVYGNGLGTNSGSTVNQPGVNSQTCLSCHDGVIAVGDVMNGTDDTITGAALDASGVILGTAGGYIGRDLQTTHPVGVVYDSGVTKAGLRIGGPDTATDGWKIYGGGDAVGSVECGSCHDPHNTTAGQTPFLKGDVATICTDCHSRK